VLTFAPSDDAYVRSSTPTTNAGTATALQIDNSPVKQFLLKFRVAGVGSDRVQSAKLRIYCVDGSDVGGNFYPLADPTAAWDERTVTWNNAPGAGATRLAALGRVVAGQWYEVDVTPLVAGDGAASLRVSSTSTNGADYASKERSGGFASQLIVTVGSSFPDTSPPSEPTNLHVASSTGSQVVLGWTASMDNVGVTNYRIWRNGAVLAATGPATSYTDSTVVASTHYEYRVQALDAAGNHSSLSAPAAIDTAPVLTLTPTADATIRADNPTAVLGAASILDTDASPVKNMLLQFSISGIGSRRVVSAKLRIYCVDGTGAGGDFHRLANPTASWSESSVNWNNAPAADPAIAASLGRVVAGTWYEVDLTSIVTGDGTLNLRITSPSSDGAGYSSKEGTFAPQLVVTTA
jgi:chitodextrinase